MGVSENEWRNWLLQLTTYLTHQNGDIVESLKIWKRNVDKVNIFLIKRKTSCFQNLKFSFHLRNLMELKNAQSAIV